jgi:hypothetical protein
MMNHGMWWMDNHGLPSIFFTQNKTDLGLPRVLHVLALFYVLSCLPAVRTLSAHRWGEPLRLLGRQGLLVFASGTVLALTGQVLMLGFPEAAWPLWLPTPVGIALMCLAAWIAEDGKRRAKATAREVARTPVPVSMQETARVRV